MSLADEDTFQIGKTLKEILKIDIEKTEEKVVQGNQQPLLEKADILNAKMTSLRGISKSITN